MPEFSRPAPTGSPDVALTMPAIDTPLAPGCGRCAGCLAPGAPPGGRPCLAEADPARWPAALAALARSDAAAFVCASRLGRALDHAWRNAHVLGRAGLLERAVVTATSLRTDLFQDLGTADRLALFARLDRGRLHALRPTPAGLAWPLRVFRGVAGAEPLRRERGVCWTASLACACWFSGHWSDTAWRPAAPAVFAADIGPAELFWYVGGVEREVVAWPARPWRLALSDGERGRRAAAHARALGADGEEADDDDDRDVEYGWGTCDT